MSSAPSPRLHSLPLLGSGKVRDYQDTIKTWNRQAPPPPLPLAVIEATSNRYREAYERLTGQSL